MDPALVGRLENIASRMESILLKHESLNKTESPSLPPKTDSIPEIIVNLDKAVNEKLDRFIQLSTAIGGEISTLGVMIQDAFDGQRDLLWTAAGCEKPSHPETMDVMLKLCSTVSCFASFKDSQRNSKYKDHVSAAENLAMGFGWVNMSKKPAEYLKDSIDAALFYINRILTTYKGNDEQQVEWAKALKELWLTLLKYVKEHHDQGLDWNSQPGTKIIRPAVKKAGIPPPPPPPPPMQFSNSPPSSSEHPDSWSNILASLNTGLDATSRLKKVTPDMQTHKNPSLRVDSKVTKCGAVLVKSSNSVTEPSKKMVEPRIFWDGKIWRVDHQVGNLAATIEVKDKKESIYIYKCTDSIIKVSGKANAITLDGCRQTSVVFDGLVAQCEVINSQSIQIQTLGELPTVSIQKTDGCHVYLSKKAQNAQIVASKSSEMNVSVQFDDDEEYTEMAIPEQFVTMVQGRSLVTQASEIV